MAFPQTRLRRLRASPGLRGLVRETDLRAQQLMLPLFISETAAGREDIPTMPGVARLSLTEAVKEASEASSLGLGAVLLFGLPRAKDSEGSSAWDEEGIVQLGIRAIKQAHPELLVASDVCL